MANSAAQMFGGLQRLRHAGIGQHAGKFLAAQAPEQIARAAWRVATSSQKALSTRSPAWWPAVSLTSLKRSRSNSNSAAERRSVLRPCEQRHAAFEERAAIGDAGQRVGQRRFALLELGAFFRHGDAQKRQAKRDEQCLESHQRNDQRFADGRSPTVAAITWANGIRASKNPACASDQAPRSASARSARDRTA